MTYRKKLLLKRLAVISGILLAVIFLALVLGYSYLGRYVVYTEDGAYFSFDGTRPSTDTETGLNILPPEDPVLITGDSVLETAALTDEESIRLSADEVNGLLVSYETLEQGDALNAIDFTESGYNMLVLEMRSEGSEILSTAPVLSLISRAKDQGIKLTAMISCLDDQEYALEHTDQALPIEGGPLWVSAGGSYWLDPTNEDVQKYVTDMILTLSGMGFQEVILNNFYFPESENIDYPSEKTREELTIEAYEKVEEAVGIRCTLGVLVTDPSTGHQALDYAEHLYVYYDSGNRLQSYIENHPDHYIVFVTASHDTRFDAYGKLMVDNEDAAFIPDSGSNSESDTD